MTYKEWAAMWNWPAAYYQKRRMAVETIDPKQLQAMADWRAESHRRFAVAWYAAQDLRADLITFMGAYRELMRRRRAQPPTVAAMYRTEATGGIP